jgi:hypothetical protein
MNRSNIVDAVKKALPDKNRVPIIEAYLVDGCSMQELCDAFAGTNWRFLIYRSGGSIQIEETSSLRQEYEQSLSRLRAAAELLVVQDMSSPNRREQFDQVRVRTSVARAARDAELTELRVNRFLFPEEQFSSDGQDRIAECLEAFGFEWNGGDTVTEIWSDLDQRIFDDLLNDFSDEAPYQVTNHDLVSLLAADGSTA